MSEIDPPASRRLRFSPARRIQAVIVVWIIAAAIVWGLWAARLPGVPGAPLTIPVWALAGVFFVAMRWPVFSRHGSFSIGLIEVPLIVGLFFAPPAVVMLGCLGGFAASLVGRRTRFTHINQTLLIAAQYTVSVGIAAVVFHAVEPDRPQDLGAWLAAYAAALAVNLIAGATLLTVLAMERKLTASTVAITTVLSLVGAFINGGFALIVAVLLWSDAKLLILTIGPLVALVLLYHSYAAERRRREGAEFLRGAGDVFRTTPELEAAMVAVLHSARAAFHATLAQIIIFAGEEHDHAFRTTIGPGDDAEVMVTVALADIPDMVALESDGVLLHRNRRDADIPTSLRNRGVDTAMAGLLRGRDRTLGALLVAGHTNAQGGTFDEPALALFRNLVVQTAAVLEKGEVEHTVASLTDLREQLSHQSFHDSLTGLPNRTLFSEKVTHALARGHRYSTATAVLLVNIDDFTSINESLGHAAGDGLLVQAAQRIVGCLRQPDSAARWGGDEFGILLEDLQDVQEAEIVARRILLVLKNPLNVGATTVRLHASVGIAVSTGGDVDTSALLRYTDVAVNAAKAAGKDCVIVYRSGMEAATVTRHQVRGELEQALEREQLALHYQPLVDLRDGRIVGVEALLRWWHPERGLIGPGDFISIAEESGLIVPIGAWALREACRQTLHWQQRYLTARNLYVSVNLSTRQLYQPLFVEEVMALLGDIKLTPTTLVFELTESMLLDHQGPLLGKLDALRKQGIRIAIDDFGTGYSSLSYLRNLPVDILKIAKPFVDDLIGDDRLGNVARAIVALGHSLQMALVAEGIEERVQLTRLRDMGCEFGQGYLLCHPVGAGQIDVLLEAGAVIPDEGDGQVIPLRR